MNKIHVSFEVECDGELHAYYESDGANFDQFLAELPSKRVNITCFLPGVSGFPATLDQAHKILLVDKRNDLIDLLEEIQCAPLMKKLDLIIDEIDGPLFRRYESDRDIYLDLVEKRGDTLGSLPSWVEVDWPRTVRNLSANFRFFYHLENGDIFAIW